MNDDESLLARWSRRKRKGAKQSDPTKNLPPSAAEVAKPVSSTAGGAFSEMPLPPIESIESATDIKAFLAPGVPLELTRAALRRAWSADPAIRDFIGLSENAWDFNAQGGVPGFGFLDLEDVRRLAAGILGEPQATAQGATGAANADHPAILAEAPPAVPATEPSKSIAAAQHEDDQRKAREPRPHRRHGSALPQ